MSKYTRKFPIDQKLPESSTAFLLSEVLAEKKKFAHKFFVSI